jgi:hypothetical protein
MGYDPSVQRLWDVTPSSPRVCLVYSIADPQSSSRYFKTVRSLSEYQDAHITGRSTRVFEVVEVVSPDDLRAVPGAQPMVLKDAWQKCSRRTERQTQTDIFLRLRELACRLRDSPNAVAELLDPRDPAYEQVLDVLRGEDWQKYFLTIEAEYVGRPHKRRPHGASALPSADTQPTQPRRTNSSRRYCVVFRELCKPLHDLTNFRDVCAAMLDCLTGTPAVLCVTSVGLTIVLAYQLMFLAGYVHRDISSGNLLYFQPSDGSPARGILSDLEHCKRYNPERGTDSQTVLVC